MGKIYKNQTALRIILDTGITLANVQNALIKYRKPDKSTGQFPGQTDQKTIYYDIQSVTDLDQDGPWIFWAHVTFNNGTVVPGEPATEKVYIESK